MSLTFELKGDNSLTVRTNNKMPVLYRNFILQIEASKVINMGEKNKIKLRLVAGYWLACGERRAAQKVAGSAGRSSA
jgi:hypothetical protein